MKRLAIIAFAALALSACTTTNAPMAEVGYPTGSLAVAAIERGDWITAERLLNEDRGVAKNDPARLVNLGRVYMATGRTGEGLAAFRQALASSRHYDVETLGGRSARTDQLAREALAHFGGVQTAAR